MLKYPSIITLLILLLQITNIASWGKVYISGTKFIFNDKDIYVNGANVPSGKWSDFGSSFDESFWSNHFAILKSNEINSVRIWIPCNHVIDYV